jgi:hypothetical protein
MDFINIQYERADGEQKGKVKYKVKDKEFFAEETAIQYYQEQGYKAIWSENNYWWDLLGLLFWDVIFAKVNGAVAVSNGGIEEVLYVDSPKFNELFKWTINTNGMPADFFTINFYKNREALINNRVKELLDSNIELLLDQSYKNNYGKNFRMIEKWDKFTLEELKVISRKLSNDIIVKILERIIKNITDNRSGLPDLIVFNDSNFFMVEVKSEKDKISEQQKNWHDFLFHLGIRVQICLINHTERQILNMEKKQEENKKLVTISFGNSTSKKRVDAIEFVGKQPTYFTNGEGKEQVYGAIFDVNDIENLFEMLDLTSGWKSQKIEVDGTEVKSTELRSVLWCFREKNKTGASTDYCKENKYEYEKNNYECRMITLNIDKWTEYGYINTDSGDWIFDKRKLEAYKNLTIENLNYCPLFNAKKVEKVFEKLPDTINPIKDKEWAYISNNHNYWFNYSGKWVGTYGDTNFPGITSMIGVQKITKKQISESVKYSKNNIEMDKILASNKSKDNMPKRKSGCFIATAVYQSYDAPEVMILRKFRDNVLNRNFFGKAFISVYYLMSPPMAEFLKTHKGLRLNIKKILDMVIKKINNTY